MGVLDTGVPRTPAQWRAALANWNAPNPIVFEAVKAQGEEIITGLTDRIVQGSIEAMSSMDGEAAELAQQAVGHGEALEELRRKIKRREITAKDARKERDRILREAMKLRQLHDSITAAWERETVIRDFPEDTLNNLYVKYSALPRPLFPF